MGKHILILGGGIAGVAAARLLRKRLPPEHTVTVAERERAFVFAPSLLWLLVGRRRPEQISRPLDRLARRGINLLEGAVEAIDPLSRRATINQRMVEADYLVIALGADLLPRQIAGLAESGHNFYDLEGASALRDELERFRSGRVVVLTAAPAYKCPAAPYEAAMLIHAYLRSRRRRAQVEVFAAEAGPMLTAGPRAAEGIRALLAERGIGYFPQRQVTRVDPATRRIVFGDGAEEPFDLLAYVPPHAAPAVTRDSGLTGDSGWIEVDRHTLSTRHPGVYAVGDAVSIPLSIGKPLPKAGVFARAQAEVVAANLVREITGTGEPRRFDGRGACFIEAGANRAGFGRGDFYAEPAPDVKFYPPAWWWHAGKVLVERRSLGWL